MMDAILALVQHDIGGRGMVHLLDGPRDRAAFANAVEVLARLPPASHVAILTGFPCLLDYDPPTETDGLGGTFALAHALHALGRHVVHILTDDVNAPVLKACIAAVPDLDVRLHAFPPGHLWTTETRAALTALYPSIAAYVAIERAGAADDGHYYTMRARDMTAMVAPLDECFAHARAHGVPTIAIGDGGNELGMGNVAATTKAKVRNGAIIATTQDCDHLIVACISDWGAYALCAGLAVRESDVAVLVDAHAVVAVANAMVAAGARDGILACQDTFVDGLPLVETLNLLHALRHVAAGARHVTRLVGKVGETEWPMLGRRKTTATSQPYLRICRLADLATLPDDAHAHHVLEITVQEIATLDSMLHPAPRLVNLQVDAAMSATELLAAMARLQVVGNSTFLGLVNVSLDVLAQALRLDAALMTSVRFVTHSDRAVLLQVASLCQQHNMALMLDHGDASPSALPLLRDDRSLYCVAAHIFE
ncbi:hypothetical protein SPRG_00060 [Saprolegnia parasitica CBS 223.65]|uniref:D-glutamate cyclase-like C-terminal domain-containing protein n=1 Tax=Saprolegnia parasitica (strain CBS 223.65) TaxID=695850 RepID=A0A067CX16_SAPPC|nr:hypothetical protein SPRG_00060 [Saprolegnia parasitica CBS 223.65]KDO35214.1 hypothetical protein SPRG_00060 [Saprolegnia parasitica CBS 223.65]|eukprot:XP_012193566.1 hypothetical protein SPRG_00060 [Saprolegnia parasitica CBS 223.65]